jgi:hypothetical protein
MQAFAAATVLQMSCDVDCDVTLKEDAVRARLTDVDARELFALNSSI